LSIHWLRVFADASHDGILAVDALGRVTHANQNASSLLGHSLDELLGRPVLDFFLLEQRIAVSLERAWTAGQPQLGLSGWLRRRSGEPLAVRFNAVPWPSDGPEAGALIAFQPAASAAFDKPVEAGSAAAPGEQDDSSSRQDRAGEADLGGRRACKNLQAGLPGMGADEWVRLCREALRDNRFVLYRQAVVDVKTRQVVAWELLIRMQGPAGELIMPGEFLPACERSGLICELDRWVIRKAFQLLADWSELDDPNIALHINISRRTLSDLALVDFIRQQLEATGIDPRRIVFEVTETAAIDDLEKALAFMHSLEELGFRFALDDFGAGFTGIGVLRRLPVHYLKIDGSFIRDLRSDPVSRQLVKTIVASAQALGKQTVAEFVPDEETLAILCEVGADFGQGYYLGRPEPIPDFDC